MKDFLEIIATELFNKLRTRFKGLQLGDQSGVATSEPGLARFFEWTFTPQNGEPVKITVELKRRETGEPMATDPKGSLTVIFNETLTQDKAWTKFIQELSTFATSYNLDFDVRNINKSNLEKRDYEYLAKSHGESKMSESKLFGTSRTSYQDFGEAKIIVKHTRPVNYELPAGRTMHIESIYIESASGERFRYPFKHLSGARAMATHVSNGGNAYDSIGSYISGLSEELGKLRHFKNYVNRSGIMSETLGDITPKVLERIDTIKSEILGLQKQNYYTQFKENFEVVESSEVPEEMMNQWVDALTIRSFNEELKGVFPYIYKLVDHVKPELDYEDLVSEMTTVNTVDTITDESHDIFSEFEEALSRIACLDDLDETDDGSIEEEDTVIDSYIPDESDSKKTISHEVVEFIESMYDRENGTFPRGETGVISAVEKKFGENAGKFANFVVEKLSCNSADTKVEEPNVELNSIKRLAGM